MKTGDRSLDETTAAGLFGLSYQLGQRTSVEPDEPHGIDLARDSTELYPLIYYAVPRNAKALPPAAVAKVNAYLRAGGAFFVDTRDAADRTGCLAEPARLLAGIDAPPLQPAPATHVLTKSYYLIRSFPGRLNGRLWIESGAADRDTRRGDGVWACSSADRTGPARGRSIAIRAKACARWMAARTPVRWLTGSASTS